jgi:hypothetical protein
VPRQQHIFLLWLILPVSNCESSGFWKYWTLPLVPHIAITINRAPRSRAVFAATKDEASDWKLASCICESYVLPCRSPSWRLRWVKSSFQLSSGIPRRPIDITHYANAMTTGTNGGGTKMLVGSIDAQITIPMKTSCKVRWLSTDVTFVDNSYKYLP